MDMQVQVDHAMTDLADQLIVALADQLMMGLVGHVMTVQEVPSTQDQVVTHMMGLEGLDILVQEEMPTMVLAGLRMMVPEDHVILALEVRVIQGLAAQAKIVQVFAGKKLKTYYTECEEVWLG